MNDVILEAVDCADDRNSVPEHYHYDTGVRKDSFAGPSVAITATLSEVYQHVLHRKLTGAPFPDVARGLNAVLVNEIGHTFASQESWPGRDFEVQMWLAGVS